MQTVEKSLGWLPVSFAVIFTFVDGFGMLPIHVTTVNEESFSIGHY